MTGEQALVLAVLAATGVQRLLETFARREKVRGEVKMAWSFYAFFFLHNLILAGSFVEFLLLEKRIVWPAFVGGIALYSGAVGLRLAAIRELGRFWSLQVEIRKEHQLITSGVFSRVRHPAYLSILGEVVSLPLLAGAWWTLLFAMVSYVPLLLLRLRREERELVAKFGDAYLDYRKRTRALIPIRRRTT